MNWKKIDLPEFDYGKYQLEDIKESADEAALQLAITLDNLGTLTAKLILEDGPRLTAIRDRMRLKKCWLQWLETKYPKNWRTAYNCLEICSTLQTLQRQHPELLAEVEEQLLSTSQRALLALGATGANLESAIEALFKCKPPTEKQVRDFQPCKPSEREELLKRVKRWGNKQGFDSDGIVELQQETCDRAREIAKENHRESPTVSDFAEAVAQTIGEEVPPVPKKKGSTVMEGITAEGYQELLGKVQQQREEILQLRERLTELEQIEARYQELLQRLEVAA